MGELIARFREAMPKPLHRFRLRTRIAIYVVVALAVGVATWTVVGGLMARDAANRIIALADEVLPAEDGEPVDSERIERAMAALEEAGNELEGLDGWILPYQVLGPVFRISPYRGGDASELGDLVDYTRAIVNGGEPILVMAEEITGEDYSASRADLDRLVTFIDQLELDVAAADASLTEATTTRAKIDDGRLSESVAARLETADRLYEVIRAGTNVMQAAPETFDAAIVVLERGQALVDKTTGSGVSEVITLGATLLEDQREISSRVDELTALYGSLKPNLEVLQPFLPLDLTEVDAAIDYGVVVLDGFGDIGGSLVRIQELAGGGFAENPEDAVELGDDLTNIADDSLALSEELQSPPDLPGIPDIPDRASELLVDLNKVALFLRDFLGFEGQRVHLVLAQDEEEIRATGGFLGAVWVLTTENGRLLDRQFISSYDVDGDLDPQHWNSAPSTFTMGLGSRVIPFRDLNWFADFPFAAERMRMSWARTQGVRPTVVVAMNQSTLAQVLASIGPVQVSGAGEAITVDSLSSSEYLRTGVDPAGQDVPESWDGQRYASYLLGNAVLEALTANENATAETLAGALADAARSRNLLISTTDPGTGGLFRKLGWDGSIGPFESDGFYVVESNVYAPKISHEIRRSFSYSVTLSGEGDSAGRLTTTYVNPTAATADECHQATASGGPPCYWMVWRVYLPTEAKVSAAPSLPAPAGSILSAFRGEGANSTTVQQGADGLPFKVREVAGMAVVEPGATQAYEMAYTLGDAATRGSDGVWRYDLLVRRQPGLGPTAVDVTIDLPAGSCVVGGEPALSVEGDSVSTEFMLDGDRVLTLWYGADAETCTREEAQGRIVSG